MGGGNAELTQEMQDTDMHMNALSVCCTVMELAAYSVVILQKPPRFLTMFIAPTMAAPRRNCWDTVKQSFIDAIDDPHQCFWEPNRWTLTMAFLIWIGGLLTTLVLMGSGLSSTYTKACVWGDQFSVDPLSVSAWSTTGFFKITSYFGVMSFAQAKTVDIIWDVIIGRGGQAVLAICSWRAFALHLTASIAIAPVTYSTYEAIFIDTNPSIFLVCRFLSGICKQKSLASRMAMSFIILSMVFIIAFPTLASAMTGYTTHFTAYVHDYSNNSIPFHKFEALVYTIHDGDRIGKTTDFRVTSPTNLLDPVRYYSMQALNHYTLDNRLFRDTHRYAFKYYYNDPIRPQSSTFEGFDLSPPLLNITIEVDEFGGFPLHENISTQIRTWIYDDKHYSQEQILERGSCQPTKDVFAWGFSFIQLNILLILLLIWSLGTLALYMHGRYSMFMGRQYSVDGRYKAIITLADAMRRQLGPSYSQTEKDIARAVRAVDGGSISHRSIFYCISVPEKVWSWLRGEKCDGFTAINGPKTSDYRKVADYICV
ncbi:unnamed protein product [Periconia digitata]|uniref:Uncharacterized protein n=1 Tax=Periconia digitata TaxID=1303443 RepID=A0A9W4UA14_9PLEO|nr:unnamed protein product [Periconia digitata]